MKIQPTGNFNADQRLISLLRLTRYKTSKSEALGCFSECCCLSALGFFMPVLLPSVQSPVPSPAPSASTEPPGQPIILGCVLLVLGVLCSLYFVICHMRPRIQGCFIPVTILIRRIRASFFPAYDDQPSLKPRYSCGNEHNQNLGAPAQLISVLKESAEDDMVRRTIKVSSWRSCPLSPKHTGQLLIVLGKGGKGRTNKHSFYEVYISRSQLPSYLQASTSATNFKFEPHEYPHNSIQPLQKSEGR